MNTETLIIVLISIAVGISGQIAYLFVVDHEKVRLSKQNLKALQQKLKTVDRTSPEFKETYNKLMAENSTIMKQSLKPTFITFIPFLIVFLIMSSFFSYAAIQTGINFLSTVSGAHYVNITALSSCAVFTGGASNIKLGGDASTYDFNTSLSSANCTLNVNFNNTSTNVSLTGLVGTNQQRVFNVNGLSLKVTPPTLILLTLPFSIPLIGSELNWFWVYLVLSFVTSISLNRVLLHYHLIA